MKNILVQKYLDLKDFFFKYKFSLKNYLVKYLNTQVKKDTFK